MQINSKSKHSIRLMAFLKDKPKTKGMATIEHLNCSAPYMEQIVAPPDQSGFR